MQQATGICHHPNLIQSLCKALCQNSICSHPELTSGVMFGPHCNIYPPAVVAVLKSGFCRKLRWGPLVP